MERLCPEYCFIEKIYNLLEKYKFTLNDFCDKKETPHIELESEAWEVIVEPLYGKIIHKSRK